MTAKGVFLLTCEYPPFPGGIGTYAGRLVGEVRAAGFDARVVAPAYPDLPAGPPEPDTHRLLGHHRISPKAALRILKLLRQTPKDWPFLAADIRSVLLSYILKPLHRRPYRAMIHGSEVAKFRKGSPLYHLVRRAYGAAQMVVANSQATLDIFSANLGAPKTGVVTYLGVEPDWFEPAPGAFEHAGLAALPADAAVICSVGRIEPRKGQLETVRLIAAARRDHGLERAVYVVAGRPEDDDYAAAVEAEAKALDVPYIATGRLSQDDLKRLYVRAACHVLCAVELPGKIEGFGLVLLEAAAQGCPSVTTAVGGIPEVMGDTGVVAAPGDLAAMARAVAGYGRDKTLRTTAGQAAKARAATFTWATCARATFPELPWDRTA